RVLLRLLVRSAELLEPLVDIDARAESATHHGPKTLERITTSRRSSVFRMREPAKRASHRVRPSETVVVLLLRKRVSKVAMPNLVFKVHEGVLVRATLTRRRVLETGPLTRLRVRLVRRREEI